MPRITAERGVRFESLADAAKEVPCGHRVVVFVNSSNNRVMTLGAPHRWPEEQSKIEVLRQGAEASKGDNGVSVEIVDGTKTERS
jgi:hypothetical protein